MKRCRQAKYYDRTRRGTCGRCAWFLPPHTADKFWKGRVHDQRTGLCLYGDAASPQYRDDSCAAHEDGTPLRRRPKSDIPAGYRAVRIDTLTMAALRPIAAARGMHVNALVRLLVDRMAARGVVESFLGAREP